MKLIILPRRGGKTYRAVQWVLQGRKGGSFLNKPSNKRALIVCNHHMKRYVMEEFGLMDGEILTWDSIPESTVGLDKEYVIDNIDMILQSIFGGRLKYITVTVGENL